MGREVIPFPWASGSTNFQPSGWPSYITVPRLVSLPGNRNWGEGGVPHKSGTLSLEMLKRVLLLSPFTKMDVTEV